MARKSLLTQSQWRKIQLRYEGGDKVKDIARDWSITPSAISVRAKKEGWVHGSDLVKGAITEKAREKVVDEMADYQANRIKKYLENNLKRAGDMYKVFDVQMWTLSQISNENAMLVNEAIAKAKAEEERMKRAEQARCSIEGGEPRPVNRVSVDMPDMGRTALDLRRLAECFTALDTTHRRMLGLDGAASVSELDDDPMAEWMKEISDAREKYTADREERKRNIEGLLGNYKNGINDDETVKNDFEEDNEEELESLE